MSKDNVPTDDELRPLTTDEVAYCRKQQNPYAKLSVSIRDAGARSARPAAEVSRPAGSLSAREFESEVRKILGFYIPDSEKGQLRPNQRAFISRNRDRSPRARFKLVQQLRKYDLSDITGIQPRFNREDGLTEAKLKEIEDSVGWEE